MRCRKHLFIQLIRTHKRAILYDSICHIDWSRIMVLIVPNIKQKTTYRICQVKLYRFILILLCNWEEITRKLTSTQIRLMPTLAFFQTSVEHLTIFYYWFTRCSSFFFIPVFHLLYIIFRHVNHGLYNVLYISQNDTISLATFAHIKYIYRRTTLYGANFISLN